MPHGLLNGLDTINDRETTYDMTNKNIIPPEFPNTKYSTDSLKIQDTCQFGREAEQQPDTAAEQIISARGFTNLVEEEIKVPDQSPVKLSLAEEQNPSPMVTVNSADLKLTDTTEGTKNSSNEMKPIPVPARMNIHNK